MHSLLLALGSSGILWDQSLERLIVSRLDPEKKEEQKSELLDHS